MLQLSCWAICTEGSAAVVFCSYQCSIVPLWRYKLYRAWNQKNDPLSSRVTLPASHCLWLLKQSAVTSRPAAATCTISLQWPSTANSEYSYHRSTSLCILFWKDLNKSWNFSIWFLAFAIFLMEDFVLLPCHVGASYEINDDKMFDFSTRKVILNLGTLWYHTWLQDTSSEISQKNSNDHDYVMKNNVIIIKHPWIYLDEVWCMVLPAAASSCHVQQT